MTIGDDPWMVDAMWRAADLTRAYLAQDRTRIADCLADLDTGQLERVLAWLVLTHDDLFDDLGEPPMTVREIDTAAALAPVETELATTAAVRRVTAGKTGLAHAVEELTLLDQIHTVAICTAVILLEAHGRTHALKHADTQTADYERMGHPRPYTIT
ncbi:hypothetical protein [Streptomyces jumonjinensis]|uniref:Uncharacterized protein n=1 Tax=Streptomyces jumonjinensis TaxID=1945 RepID=A0A646KTH0_STRJU|nr:hypothetical protein [Streptomyces jumonjinensis]MQT05161.1 hypothetical protein [Streptomyces jumonjinensis]